MSANNNNPLLALQNMDICVTCRRSPDGLMNDIMRFILCEYCKNGSNYEELREEDIIRLKEMASQQNAYLQYKQSKQNKHRMISYSD